MKDDIIQVMIDTTVFAVMDEVVECLDEVVEIVEAHRGNRENGKMSQKMLIIAQ